MWWTTHSIKCQYGKKVFFFNSIEDFLENEAAEEERDTLEDIEREKAFIEELENGKKRMATYLSESEMRLRGLDALIASHEDKLRTNGEKLEEIRSKIKVAMREKMAHEVRKYWNNSCKSTACCG